MLRKLIEQAHIVENENLKRVEVENRMPSGPPPPLTSGSMTMEHEGRKYVVYWEPHVNKVMSHNFTLHYL